MVLRRVPAHLRTRAGKERLKRLRRYANALRGHYGVAVWLCGSALLDVNSRPRDWDIRLTLSEDEFRRRYGRAKAWENEGTTGRWTEVRWRWSDDCVKQSRDGWWRTGLNADVQIYPESHARVYRSHNRFRLDTRKRRRR